MRDKVIAVLDVGWLVRLVVAEHWSSTCWGTLTLGFLALGVVG